MEFLIEDHLSKSVDLKPEANDIETIDPDFGHNDVDDIDINHPGDEEDFNHDDDLDLSDSMSTDETSQMIIDCVDVVQQFALPWLYERRAFDPAERHVLKDLIKRAKISAAKGEDLKTTAQESALLIRYDEVTYYADEIVPFTPEEVEKIKKPLNKLVEKIKIKTSPVSALIITGIFITLPRLIPFINLSKQRRKFSKSGE